MLTINPIRWLNQHETIDRLKDFNPFASKVVREIRLDFNEYLAWEVGFIQVALEEGPADVKVVDVEMVSVLDGVSEVSGDHAILVRIVVSWCIGGDIGVGWLVVAEGNQARRAFSEGTSGVKLFATDDFAVEKNGVRGAIGELDLAQRIELVSLLVHFFRDGRHHLRFALVLHRFGNRVFAFTRRRAVDSNNAVVFGAEISIVMRGRRGP